MEDTLMSNHKLLMETWRRFLKESRESVTEVDGKPIHLYFYAPDSPEFKIFLYVINKTSAGFDSSQVIGGIECVLTEEPCIPKTLQVITSYRDSDYTGTGLGPLLYDLAFFVAHSMGYGLTSDRESGSKRGARDRWSKIEADPTYQKQTTKAGNDTFDYYKDTPDPDDDCEKDEYDDSNATDHSFIKKDTDKIHSVLTQLEANHMNYLDTMSDSKEKKIFLDDIRRRSFDLFHTEYDIASY
tara:strand:- start:24 stop:746 length:723 start_codon:yes stop_codon:yes gene_type:complete